MACGEEHEMGTNGYLLGIEIILIVIAVELSVLLGIVFARTPRR